MSLDHFALISVELVLSSFQSQFSIAIGFQVRPQRPPWLTSWKIRGQRDRIKVSKQNVLKKQSIVSSNKIDT